MIFVLSGAPGAGKGTQADLLVKNRNYRKVSTGDSLRNQIKAGSPIGKSAEAVMARGELVSDDVLLEILRQELGHKSDEVIILDGYPRNLAQAKSLGMLQHHKVVGCIHIDVNRDLLVSRLSGRRVCSNCGASFHVQEAPPRADGICDRCKGQLIRRPDDEPESILKRLDVYNKSTEPVFEHYRGQGNYIKISGVGDPQEVQVLLLKAIDKCLAES